jgi:CBS domain containing-hemolysin-like protein
LSDLIHVPIEDEEHNTVAGFLMAKTEKVPSAGDQIRYLDVVFTVESVDGRRAALVRIELMRGIETQSESAGEAPPGDSA